MNQLNALCPDEDELVRLMGPDSDEPPPSELYAHVERCDNCRQRLSRLETALRNVQDVYSTVPSEGRQSPAQESVPSRIGKYYVIGPLGQGGQGSIYRALHPNLGREVVIKLSRRPLEVLSGKRDRMAEEARMLQELNHPNLGSGVLDLDFEEGPGGLRPFLVMEYIRGQSLSQYVREKGKLTPDAAARLLIPLARGLGAAHRRGVRHLDIKPGNILIDELGRPRLIDFGMALLKDAWEQPSEVPGGTLEFMAPEQAAGDLAHLDPRTDIYGLGGVLFFLLAGQPPRVGPSREALLDRAMKGDVDFPLLISRKAPRSLRGICRRALAPNPDDRFTTADSFADALEGYLRLPRRRAFLIVAGGTLLGSLAAGWALWPGPAIPKDSQFLVSNIRRRATIHERLPDALPLLAGDSFEVTCRLPRGYRPALFYLNSEGRLDAPSNFRMRSGAEFDHFSFPDSGLVTLQGPPGMELLLVCAGRTRPRLENVEDLLEGERSWPLIPPHIALLIDREKVQPVTTGTRDRDLRPAAGDALKTLQDRLETLRQRLSERLPFFAGVVYRVSGD